MRTWALLLVAAFVLAGCSGPGASDKSDDVRDTGAIRGIALDEAVRPMAGVAVSLVGGATVATGDDGAFTFEGLPAGAYVLQASKAGFVGVQASVEVVAGSAEAPLVRLEMRAVPSQQPFAEALSFNGFLTFGAAVGVTSLGTTILPLLADQVTDTGSWSVQFNQLPMWAQGELVWDATQDTGGMLVWEMTNTSNTPSGHHETSTSPALAYWNTSVLNEPDHIVSTLDPARGILYRFFAGPHPMLAPGGGVLPSPSTCPPVPGQPTNPCAFGFGLTVQQRVDAYVHHFYNFLPPEDWRFTVDGPPVLPRS